METKLISKRQYNYLFRHIINNHEIIKKLLEKEPDVHDYIEYNRPSSEGEKLGLTDKQIRYLFANIKNVINQLKDETDMYQEPVREEVVENVEVGLTQEEIDYLFKQVNQDVQILESILSNEAYSICETDADSDEEIKGIDETSTTSEHEDKEEDVNDEKTIEKEVPNSDEIRKLRIGNIIVIVQLFITSLIILFSDWLVLHHNK